MPTEYIEELGLKVGDKCLVVFKPSHLTYIEDGNVVECVLDAIEEVKNLTIDNETILRKYRVSFGLQNTTVTPDFIFSLQQKAEANILARTLLENSINKAKQNIENLEKALLLIET